jgi:hypothetical protein
VDFTIPAEIQSTLDQLDEFIEREIKPLEANGDNIRFFDHRREWARTDFDNGGVPRADWEDLLREMRRRADAAGWLRLALPAEYGGRDASNLNRRESDVAPTTTPDTQQPGRQRTVSPVSRPRQHPTHSLQRAFQTGGRRSVNAIWPSWASSESIACR